MASTAHKRYAEILRDVEDLINDHIAHQRKGSPERSKLKLLVPDVGVFFTPLLLEKAFEYQDGRRRISSRRFVPPSFNDIRLTLNSAQMLSLVEGGPLELVTFDGDVTLYPDGHSLETDNPVISRIMDLLVRGIKVAIVTAAGYTETSKYYGRLHGLLNSIQHNRTMFDDPVLIVLGGESNYLFRFDPEAKHMLRYIDRRDWLLPEMIEWTEENIQALLDVAEQALRECILNMRLSAQILRKERAVGIIPSNEPGSQRFTREQLEETVLVTQQVVEMSPVAKQLPFCAFNGQYLTSSTHPIIPGPLMFHPGGNDVFVDIGDKGWGVMACQQYLGGIEGSKTLHIGDQFLSAGANDFKVSPQYD